MLKRIQAALSKAGLPETPIDPDRPLTDYGLDSLVQVLAVIEFEKAFAIKIPAREIKSEIFTSVHTLEVFLKTLGAQ